MVSKQDFHSGFFLLVSLRVCQAKVRDFCLCPWHSMAISTNTTVHWKHYSLTALEQLVCPPRPSISAVSKFGSRCSSFLELSTSSSLLPLGRASAKVYWKSWNQ